MWPRVSGCGFEVPGGCGLEVPSGCGLMLARVFCKEVGVAWYWPARAVFSSGIWMCFPIPSSLGVSFSSTSTGPLFPFTLPLSL